jgi:hypothetical protein
LIIKNLFFKKKSVIKPGSSKNLRSTHGSLVSKNFS